MFQFGTLKVRGMQIRKDDIHGLKELGDVRAYAERMLNANTLKEEFEGGVIRRKSFCEALDIGESTLSTWLQTGRVPRVAAVAYMLWLVTQKLRDDLRHREELGVEWYVIRCCDGYAVVKPADRDSGEPADRVVATGIESADLAQQIATAHSPRFREVLDQAIDALWNYEEQFEDKGNWVADRATALERARDFNLDSASIADLSAPSIDQL
jgi:hypothetical protein